MIADLIAFADETYHPSQDLMLFDPVDTWKKTNLKGGTYTIREMLVPVFQNGVCIYQSPSVMKIRDYCKEELDTLWDEAKRLTNPHKAHIDLSKKLYITKCELLNEMSQTVRAKRKK